MEKLTPLIIIRYHPALVFIYRFCFCGCFFLFFVLFSRFTLLTTIRNRVILKGFYRKSANNKNLTAGKSKIVFTNRTSAAWAAAAPRWPSGVGWTASGTRRHRDGRRATRHWASTWCNCPSP